MWGGLLMPIQSDQRRSVQARLTVTLAPGQREALEAIAKRNHATLAFVVRYALTQFIESHRDSQLPLAFPSIPGHSGSEV